MRSILIFALITVLASAGAPRKGIVPPYRVAVLDGDGAVNSLQTRAAREAVVQVLDGSGKPISGAFVEFDVPKAGPGALFVKGASHFATTTNSDGIAKATPKNNGVAGPFSMLVHVSYNGQTIGEMTVHQTNVARNMARVPGGGRNQEPFPDASMSTAVLGIALGDQFMINGTPTPNNANLAPGNHVQTQANPVTIYIHDHCEFLVGPHSSVVIQPHLLSVMSGAVRAKHFGDCKFGYGGLWVTSPSPNGDGVVALSDSHLEVGSVNGDLQIANAVKVVGTVKPGTVSAFNFATSTDAASGASLTSPVSTKVAIMLGAGTAASLTGLGLAVTAIVQPAPTSTSP